ncbi:STM4014 family protein [Xanthomonas sp. WHRI 10064A]|uniref:STM4014 family protein n=1 Tax=unclassified Xanthomonas TaxID=2643310 RepID=UPI002B229ED6|nr:MULTISPECIES: STM4014 family protein [unclassified Xanthomonas]MEA9590083.1 STM4014 family protein [Xanthomonas sp. WHRI 10064B]MEA9617475.1 STM4014 family protein [Xanthomonas sp. WHRI 10064A]
MVGPQGSRRVAALQQALQAQGQPAATVFDYLQLLDTAAPLQDWLARHPAALVKLESPGEAPALHQALIVRGWHCLGQPGPAPAPLAHGELAHQHLWHAGFADLLATLPAARYLNPPADLLAMTDKLGCQQRLAAAGVSVPALLGTIDSYAGLRECLQASGCTQAFLKPRYGSSGAGVLAYRWHRDGRQIASGSAELVVQDGQVRVFNALRQRRYTRTDEIAPLVDAIAAQGAYLEQWIPKPRAPGLPGYHYDLRVVAFDGVARQRVARASRGPLTNLHLGNWRLPAQAWQSANVDAAVASTVAQAASAFADSRMIGFDLIQRAGRCHVLEANGFGDLLPELRWQGRTTYEDQAALGAIAAAAGMTVDTLPEGLLHG